MQDERKRILQLVEKGIISAQEAIDLLEKLDTTETTEDAVKETVKTEQQPKKEDHKEPEFKKEDFFDDEEWNGKSSKEDEFIEDIKKEFSQFSSKFMDFIGSAVTKVKDIDFSTFSPTGEKVSWSVTLDDQSFDNVSVDMPNGQLTVRDSADGSAYVEVEATPMLQFGSSTEMSEEDIKEQLVITNDAGTLRLKNTAKTLKTDVVLFVPKKDYRKVRANLINGGFTMHSLNVDQLRVDTKNGSIDLSDLTFDSAEIEALNGHIDIRDVAGREVEVETLNGRVYIDGSIRTIDAKSINGHVVLTTKSQQAERIKAQTTAGSIEIYIPKTMSIIGEVSSAFGKMDVDLPDVDHLNETSQLFNKSLRFKKDVEDTQRLTIDGETKTGSVVIRYTI